MRTGPWLVRAVTLGCLWGSVGEGARAVDEGARALDEGGGPGLAAAAGEILDSALDTSGAVAVQPVALAAGTARIRLIEGRLFPTTPVAGRPHELVFVGTGRFEVEPPDEIERGQLELFTGRGALEVEIREAVLALGQDAALDRLLSGPPAEPDPAAAARAEELYSEWKASGGRRHMGVEIAQARSAASDPLFQSFFAGWFFCEELEDFYYVFAPDAWEQVTLGRFVPLELSKLQTGRIARELHREQRQGRLIGLEVGHLGTWDTWMSTSLLAEDGTPRRGLPGPAIEHFDIEVDLDDRSLELEGVARLNLRGQSYATPVVQLALNPNLSLRSVASDSGEPLESFRSAEEIVVRLDPPLEPGDERVIEIGYGGRLIESDGKARYLSDTLTWYPQLERPTRATYDVTFRWPDRYQLIGSGERVDSGSEGGRAWERRRLDLPSWAFSFEIGRYELTRERVGEVDVVLAVDAESRRSIGDNRDEVMRAIRECLIYYQEIFGPYPFAELYVTTTPRLYSQAPPGLVTLSSIALADNLLGRLLRDLDPKILVAHELAHQWWGHVVFWESYRDQWISEAMANYAATLYARNRLGKGDARPTAGWQSGLLASAGGGRTRESLGPVVLGQRLQSSKSSSAYQDIVYRKGAVVLDMLARRFGEEAFLRILRVVLDGAAGHALSTGDLIGLVERVSGVDLDAFAEQFVYGTGLPVVFYDYEIQATADGRWSLRGEARQHAPYRYVYGFRGLPDGGLDVTRTSVDEMDVAGVELVVPLQVSVFDPGYATPAGESDGSAASGTAGGSGGSGGSGDGAGAEARGNRIVQYHVLITGASTPIELTLDLEPKQMWLDAGNWVYGRFFNQEHDPKGVLLFRALDVAAEGATEEALELLERARDAELPSVRGLTGEPLDEERVEARSLRLDAFLWVEQARLLLDRDEVASADEAFEKGVLLYEAANRRDGSGGTLPDAARLLSARLALRKGDPGRAYRDLRREVLQQRNLITVEAYQLTALAARETGHQRALEQALEVLESRDVDVSLLRSGAS
jgi:hypothetical protein